MAYKYEEEINQTWEQYREKWLEEYNRLINQLPSLKSQIISALTSDFLGCLSQNGKQGFNLHYYFDENGLHKKEEEIEDLPTIAFPYLDSTAKNVFGLYFLGMIGVTPDDKKYYLIKIGASSDIKKRVSQYYGMNPMIYHNDIHIEFNCNRSQLEKAEHNCHLYLADKAYGRAYKANEWFYVTEETYFELCETFADKEMFKAIAEGRD